MLVRRGKAWKNNENVFSVDLRRTCLHSAVVDLCAQVFSHHVHSRGAVHPAGGAERAAVRRDAACSPASPAPAAREPQRRVAPARRDQHGDADAARRRRRLPRRRAAARRHDDDDDRREHVRPAEADGPGRAPHRHARHQLHHTLQLSAQLLHLLRHEPAVPADVLSAVRRRSGGRRHRRRVGSADHAAGRLPRQVRGRR